MFVFTGIRISCGVHWIIQKKHSKSNQCNSVTHSLLFIFRQTGFSSFFVCFMKSILIFWRILNLQAQVSCEWVCCWYSAWSELFLWAGAIPQPAPSLVCCSARLASDKVEENFNALNTQLCCKFYYSSGTQQTMSNADWSGIYDDC